MNLFIRKEPGIASSTAMGCLFVFSIVLAWMPVTTRAETPSPEVPSCGADGVVALDHTIRLTIPNAPSWLSNQPKNLRLLLDGIEVPNPDIRTDQIAKGTIYFVLRRNPYDLTSIDAWNKILGGSFRFCEPPKMVRVTVGSGNDVLYSLAELPVRQIEALWIFVWAVVMAGLGWTLFRLGRETNLLRDGARPTDGKKRCYSLARTQMAFWLFITVGAYLFLLMAIKDPNTLTPDVLGLMGISAATGFAAIAVDNSKRTALQGQLNDATIALSRLDPPADNTQAAQRIQLKAQVTGLQDQLVVSSSKGFWTDILCDGAGVSFHRLQIIIWTLVVGVVFALSVLNNLSMPTLSATLLGLMGLSGGTYVGFKIPEKLS
jgi:hypothetical protein